MSNIITLDKEREMFWFYGRGDEYTNERHPYRQLHNQYVYVEALTVTKRLT